MIKLIVARDTLITYPTFNKHFYIHNDTKNFHLGYFITQVVKLIVFYIQNLLGN